MAKKKAEQEQARLDAEDRATWLDRIGKQGEKVRTLRAEWVAASRLWRRLRAERIALERRFVVLASRGRPDAANVVALSMSVEDTAKKEMDALEARRMAWQKWLKAREELRHMGRLFSASRAGLEALPEFDDPDLRPAGEKAGKGQKDRGNGRQKKGG